MIESKFYIFDDTGIKWYVTDRSKKGTPYCIEHHLPLKEPAYSWEEYFICLECEDVKSVPRGAQDQAEYVVYKLKAKDVAKVDIINYNGELIPVAKARDKASDHWVTAQIMESKHGKHLVIYAGKKGSRNKAQIFVDTANGKLAFDHKDLKPTEIFAKVEAIFVDGTKMAIQGNEPTTKS